MYTSTSSQYIQQQKRKKNLQEKLKQKFEILDRSYQSEDIEKLSDNMLFLEQYSLTSINNRLIEQTKKPKFLEALTEVNFTSGLLKGNQKISNEDIFYESSEDHNIDLKVSINSVTYLIQIKSPAKSEFRNKQDNLMEEIKRKASEIRIPKFFSLTIPQNFSKNDVDELIEFLKDKSVLKIDSNEFEFLGKNGVKVLIRFYLPKEQKLSCLTLHDYKDLNIINMIGKITDQLIKTLEKAGTAFKANTNLKIINLIAIEINQNVNAIDLCEATFGSEFFEDSFPKKILRNNDGLFNNADFKSKVFGIIGLIKKEKNSFVSDYFHVLLVNPDFREQSSNILNLISDIKIIHNNTFIETNFGFS